RASWQTTDHCSVTTNFGPTHAIFLGLAKYAHRQHSAVGHSDNVKCTTRIVGCDRLHSPGNVVNAISNQPLGHGGSTTSAVIPAASDARRIDDHVTALDGLFGKPGKPFSGTRRCQCRMQHQNECGGIVWFSRRGGNNIITAIGTVMNFTDFPGMVKTAKNGMVGAAR